MRGTKLPVTWTLQRWRMVIGLAMLGGLVLITAFASTGTLVGILGVVLVAMLAGRMK